ncbi:MAG: hypothetical protein JWP78_3887 [Mucilaginibacter sp.]|nr:hypothetical protein [Mucilaginibacter sp.]
MLVTSLFFLWGFAYGLLDGLKGVTYWSQVLKGRVNQDKY